MIKQHASTVIARLRQESVPGLRVLLDMIDQDIESNSIIPFSRLTTIHFARFVILEASELDGEMIPPQLSFSSNFDGPLDDHLKELFSVAGSGFDQVYQHCADYNAEGDISQKITYFKQHSLPPPNAFYIGHRGLSVQMIQKQNQIRNAIEMFLNQNPQDNYKPSEIRQNILNFLESAGLRDIKPPEIVLPSLWGPILILLGSILLLGLVISWAFVLKLFIAIVIFLIIWTIILRIKEKTDPEIQIETDDWKKDNLIQKIQTLKKDEDFVVQNQLTHLVPIKKGLFRLITLKTVLWAINLLANVFYNKGKLGNIPTIHFARWVIIDNNRRLLFFSNFDGSWESYLGDFIDKAAVGLTGVWSNSELFPKTKFLVFEGATDEERFKYWTRTYQITTQVWYTAYKNLTVVNVLNNNEIHQGIWKEKMTENEIIDWLRKL